MTISDFTKITKRISIKYLASQGTDVVKFRKFFICFNHRTGRVHAQIPNTTAGHGIVAKVKQLTTGSSPAKIRTQMGEGLGPEICDGNTKSNSQTPSLPEPTEAVPPPLEKEIRLHLCEDGSLWPWPPIRMPLCKAQPHCTS